VGDRKGMPMVDDMQRLDPPPETLWASPGMGEDYACPDWDSGVFHEFNEGFPHETKYIRYDIFTSAYDRLIALESRTFWQRVWGGWGNVDRARNLAREVGDLRGRTRCLEAMVEELVKVNAELKALVFANVRQVLHSKTDYEISGATQAEIERAIVKAFAPKEPRHD